LPKLLFFKRTLKRGGGNKRGNTRRRIVTVVVTRSNLWGMQVSFEKKTERSKRKVKHTVLLP